LTGAEYKPPRGETTKNQLLRAAEGLFADRGLANVSSRAIVTAAGQRNESALQYHFGGLNGLITDLHEERSGQLLRERQRVLAEMEPLGDRPAPETIAELMIRPAFQLAQRDIGFRTYMKVFAHLALHSNRRLTDLLAERRDPGVAEIRLLLVLALPDLHPQLLDVRLESVARFATLEMSGHAREKRAFKGRFAEFFFANLLDEIVALLTASPSRRTRSLLGPAKR
jgi:AcrR family transcriptional regulator